MARPAEVIRKVKDLESDIEEVLSILLKVK
jgi:hypothetical protein